MDALCFGFKSFGQLSNSKVSSALSMLKSHGMYKYIKFVTFSWSKCYIIAGINYILIVTTSYKNSNFHFHFYVV